MKKQTDETTPEEATEEPAAETEETPAVHDMSNSDVKKHPLFRKLAKELKAEREAKQDASAPEATAAHIDELLASKDAAFSALKAAHKKELLETTIKSELIKNGFVNDMFIKGALDGFDVETHGSASAYAESLANDTANKAFLASTRTAHSAPGAPKIRGGNAMTPGQIREMQRSDFDGGSLEAREKVREYLKSYYDKHEHLPPGL